MQSESEQSSVVLGLQRAAHRTVHALGEALTHLGLTAAEINALANLADDRQRTVAELSAAVGAKSSTLTGILDRLERRDLVRRQPHPTDRRAFLVVLTEPGGRAADEIWRAITDLEHRLLAGLPATTLTGFRTVLNAVSTEDTR